MKATKSEQTQMFINCYKFLNIGQLDEEIDQFVTYNYAFYTDPKKKTYRLQVTDNSFLVINSLDGSRFGMSFIPSIINPTSISIELSNLGSNLEQRVIISFDELGINTSVRKYYTTMSGDSRSMSKENIDTVYIDGKRRYRKEQSYHIGKNVFEDSSYSKQVITYLSALDSSYVTSTKVIAEERAYYQTSESYEKFDGESCSTITTTEFIDAVERFEQEKKDIKQKKKNM